METSSASKELHYKFSVVRTTEAAVVPPPLALLFRAVVRWWYTVVNETNLVVRAVVNRTGGTVPPHTAYGGTRTTACTTAPECTYGTKNCSDRDSNPRPLCLRCATSTIKPCEQDTTLSHLVFLYHFLWLFLRQHMLISSFFGGAVRKEEKKIFQKS